MVGFFFFFGVDGYVPGTTGVRFFYYWNTHERRSTVVLLSRLVGQQLSISPLCI